MSQSNAIINALRQFTAPDVFNPWANDDPLDLPANSGAANRRIRLRQHFDCDPRFLLIGEAPGYQGCHFSGVPFANEKLLLAGAVPRVSIAGRITTRPKPWSEPSATVVWRTLHALGIAERTILWNAFAFHPHKSGEPMSNRKPTRGELDAGASFLEAVLDHFNGVPRVAVGQVSAGLLSKIGKPARVTVRHPSMGGARAFEAGLSALAGSS